MRAEDAGWSAQEITRAIATQGQGLPRIDFAAEDEQCPSCGGRLRVQKSTRRTVITLAHGGFEAREIYKTCERGACPPLGSRVLHEQVRRGQRYGYDLIVHVGLGRYLDGRQREEIREALWAGHGITLSSGTISVLCDRFLSLLQSLHLRRAPELRAALHGGYPLHIDATCERGKGGLFVCMGGWRQWVLGAERVASESAERLAPLVERTVAAFGIPVAVVRDMGEGGSGAVKSLREAGVPDLICHYHFLAAIGEKLLEKCHRHLRYMIRRAETRAKMRTLLRDLRDYGPSPSVEGRFGSGSVRDELKALLLWVLEGDGRKHAPFPFALPHLEFIRRARQVGERADQWVPCPRTQPERRAIAHLRRLVGRLERDPRLAPTVHELDERWREFSELRDVLRLSDAEFPRGTTRYHQRQLPVLELIRLQQIEQAVDDYRTQLQSRVSSGDREPRRSRSAPGIILDYLKRYRARLFGHPARLDTEGQVVAVVDRTNNVIEQFFGQEKRRLRRRLGRAHLGRDLEQQPAAVALVSNLRSPGYVRVLCGSLDHLPAAFAALEIEAATETIPVTRENRDKPVQQCVRQLLASTLPPSNATSDPADRLPAPQLEFPDLSSIWPELEALSEDELRERCAKVFAAPPKNGAKRRDPRLPPAGTVLTRRFGDRNHRVKVLGSGFDYQGKRYTAISSVAKEITGTTYNGYRFFRLNRPWGESGGKRPRDRRRRTTTRPVAAATES